VLLAGGAALDHLAARIYQQQRPRLERLVTTAMGQPLQLGAYAGLRPMGLAAGPSRFLPAAQNRSSIEATGVELSLDPLASLLQRAWVLQIRVLNPTVQLRRNARGSFWELPAQRPGREPPRLGLRIQVPSAGQGVLHSADGARLPFRIRGSADLWLWSRDLNLRGWIDPQAGGHLPFQVEANWQQRNWQLSLQPKTVPVAPLLPLLPSGLHAQLVGHVTGLLDGQLRFGRQGARARCQGAVRASQLAWRRSGTLPPLQLSGATLRCADSLVQLNPSAVRWGSWRGRLDGSLRLASGRLQLQLAASDPKQGQRLQVQLKGPWRNPDLHLTGAWPRRQLQLLADVAIRSQPGLRLQLAQLQLRRAGGVLTARGELWPLLQLRSEEVRPGRALPASLLSLLGSDPQLQFSLRQLGDWSKPRLQLDLRQVANPLIGTWFAQLRWRPDLLELEQLRAPHLQASGRLPLQRTGKGPWGSGPLQLELDLRRFPLERLSPMLGTRLRGELDAWGQVYGPLGQLQPQLELLVQQPGVGPLRLSESWRGSLRGLAAGGADLALQALAPAPAGQLEARLDRRWLPSRAVLQRSDGSLAFQGDPRRYTWKARAFPLAGLQLALGPTGRFQPLQGGLSGSGQLDLQPLWINGRVAVQRPQLLGIYGRSLVASGTYRQRHYSAQGMWQGERDDSVRLQLKGEQGAAFWGRFEARQFGSEAIRQLLEASQRWRSGPLLLTGSAKDLNGLAIDGLGLSLSDQLALLQQANQDLLRNRQLHSGIRDGFDPADLQGLVNADLTLVGPRLDRLSLDLVADGHLWVRGEDRDEALGAEPLRVTLRGPLNGGGSFTIEHLPLALLALLVPVPDGLRGGLAARGQVQFARAGRRPELQISLALQDASLAGQPLSLERGDLALQRDSLSLDWSLRSGGAANSIDLKGTVPLDPSSDALELRVASRGDGLAFLSVLGGPGLQWQQGSADLQLLVRGSLEAPLANGFLRFRDGVLQVAGQTMRDLEATVLFDFRELELQQLTARVGERGLISGSGQLGLVQPIEQPVRPLRLQVQQAPFKLPRMQAQADGEVRVAGSLRRPALSGEVQLSRGSINVQPGQLATEAEPTRPVTVPELVEARWDFSRPLLVMGQQMESSASRDLRGAVPNLPFLQLQGLRLRLGPDLKVGVPNVLNFNTGGVLTLSGALDPSLQVSGVVRLLNGRLNLFTTTFSLDPDAPNVAVFTPSLGLIPYIDIALRTRVSDTLVANQSNRSSLYDWNVAAPVNSIDQLRLVKVRVEASGPADQLAENIRLTSSPPLPQERLVALIGGNSLVGLAGGNAGAALATVLGQSLLSPLVSGLSDAFGQRLTFALYPTFFTPAEVLATENRSRRLPSQLVLGSEIGLDITERFNFSVLAAPNRSDIPPQVTLRYQASERLGVQTSVDTEGRWQGQLQLLLRF